MTPDFSLLEARGAAEDARRIVARGGDPARDKLGRKAADTFAELAEQWLTQHCEINKRPASVRNDRSILRLHVLPQIGPMKAAEVKRRDISLLLATSVRSPDRRFAGNSVRKTRARKLDSARRTVRNPNHVYAVVRATYRWALAQGLVESDPTWGMRPPVVEVKPRERVLSPDEIRRFWSNLDNAPIPEMFRILFRLSLVTVQRIGEVGGIDMAHLDVDAAAPVWTIPGTLTKNHEPHKVWLSVMAVELTKQARALAPDSRWLFPLPSSGSTHFCMGAGCSSVLDHRPTTSAADGCDEFGRVEDGRGSLGPMASAPFPISAHRTGGPDFRSPALRLASPQGTRRGTSGQAF